MPMPIKAFDAIHIAVKASGTYPTFQPNQSKHAFALSFTRSFCVYNVHSDLIHLEWTTLEHSNYPECANQKVFLRAFALFPHGLYVHNVGCCVVCGRCHQPLASLPSSHNATSTLPTFKTHLDHLSHQHKQLQQLDDISIVSHYRFSITYSPMIQLPFLLLLYGIAKLHSSTMDQMLAGRSSCENTPSRYFIHYKLTLLAQTLSSSRGHSISRQGMTVCCFPISYYSHLLFRQR